MFGNESARSETLNRQSPQQSPVVLERSSYLGVEDSTSVGIISVEVVVPTDHPFLVIIPSKTSRGVSGKLWVRIPSETLHFSDLS